MTKGALNDEVSDSFDLIRDMFAPEAAMKDQQSLVDFAKIMRDKMQQVISRNEFKVEYVDSVTGLDVVKHTFNEEFFTLVRNIIQPILNILTMLHPELLQGTKLLIH